MLVHKNMGKYRKVLIRSKIVYDKSGHKYRGSAQLEDNFAGDLMHKMGVSYDEPKDPKISHGRLPHPECVAGMEECDHIRELDTGYTNLTEEVLKRAREKHPDGFAAFCAKITIGIKNNSDTTTEFTGICDADYVIDQDPHRYSILKPEDEISLLLERKGEIRDSSGYFIKSIKIPGLRWDNIENLRVFHYSEMKNGVKELLGEYWEKFRLMLNPFLLGLVTVEALNVITHFSYDGKQDENGFNEAFKEMIKKKDRVFSKFEKGNGCIAFQKKAERFMKEISSTRSL